MRYLSLLLLSFNSDTTFFSGGRGTLCLLNKRSCSCSPPARLDVCSRLGLVPVMIASEVSTRSGSRPQSIAIIGGGASGIFSAISAAEQIQQSEMDTEVVVLEASGSTLKKVKISGGGRCNVMHDTSKPVSTILDGYPRGKVELNGIFCKRFGPEDAKEWFTSRGVQLKTEEDGRMFPVTDSSQTIIDTLMAAAQNAGVDIRLRSKVEGVEKDGNLFKLQLNEKRGNEALSSEEHFDAIVLATGSSPFGYRIAQDLGHTLVRQVPSLFTLSTKRDVEEGGLLYGLAGVSVPDAKVSFRVPHSSTEGAPKKGKNKANRIEQTGPLLVTHHGISGPAALRLSAFGARLLHETNYCGELTVHWAPSLGTIEQISEKLWRLTTLIGKKALGTYCPLSLKDGRAAIPRSLWSAMVLASDLDPDQTWGGLPKKTVRKLASQISQTKLQMTGKGTFKDEFVTAGGVSLQEIDMRTMSSRRALGMFLCGEVVDIDGVTGGYNFLNCWGTGYIAGQSVVKYLRWLREKEARIREQSLTDAVATSL